MIYNFVRGIITLLFSALGFYLDSLLLDFNLLHFQGVYFSPISIYVTMITFLAMSGFLLAPVGIRSFLSFLHWLDSRLIHVPTLDLVIGAIGIIIGLIISTLLSNSFIKIQFFGPLLAIILNLSFGYLGFIIGTERKGDVLGFLNSFPIFRTLGDNTRLSQP